MNKYVEGTTLVIVKDSHDWDGHDLPIGTVVEVVEIMPRVLWEHLPPSIQLLLSTTFQVEEGTSVESRIRVVTENGEEVNVMFDDVELAEEYIPVINELELIGGAFIQMTVDCFYDGFGAGDVFEVESDGSHFYITDKDGDIRFLDDHEDEFKIIA